MNTSKSLDLKSKIQAYHCEACKLHDGSLEVAEKRIMAAIEEAVEGLINKQYEKALKNLADK